MASSGKPKTTMAKLRREATLRERRMEKAARKRIRKEGGPELSQLDEPYAEAQASSADAPASEPAADEGSEPAALAVDEGSEPAALAADEGPEQATHESSEPAVGESSEPAVGESS